MLKDLIDAFIIITIAGFSGIGCNLVYSNLIYPAQSNMGYFFSAANAIYIFILLLKSWNKEQKK